MANTLPQGDMRPAVGPVGQPGAADNLMRMSQAETNRNSVRAVTVGQGNDRMVVYPVPQQVTTTDLNETWEMYLVLTKYGPRIIRASRFEKPITKPESISNEMRADMLASLAKVEVGTAQLKPGERAYVEYVDNKGRTHMSYNLPGVVGGYGGIKDKNGSYNESNRLVGLDDLKRVFGVDLTQTQIEALNKKK